MDYRTGINKYVSGQGWVGPADFLDRVSSRWTGCVVCCVVLFSGPLFLYS